MNNATDICHKCEKAEPTPSMTYVDENDKYDDRLICDECIEKKEKEKK